MWGAGLAQTKEWKKKNKDYTFILSVVDALSKYASAVPLEDAKAETMKQAFEKAMMGRITRCLWLD